MRATKVSKKELDKAAVKRIFHASTKAVHVHEKTPVHVHGTPKCTGGGLRALSGEE